MAEFEHQEKVDQFYPLRDEEGEFIEGQLRLKIQFIWSFKKYFIDKKAKAELHQTNCQRNLHEVEKYASLYDKPFGILLFGDLNNILEKKLHEKDDEGDDFIEMSKRRSVSLSPRMSRNSVIVNTLEKFVAGNFS